jgi:ADP-heptose:LPS heptosyltransferase
MSPFAQKLYAFALARYFDWLRVVHRRPLALFFRDGGIGDILCTFPAAAALCDRHKDAYKIYLTNPGFVTLPPLLGRVDRVMGIKCNDLVAGKVRGHARYRFRYPDEDPDGSSSKYLADEFALPFGLPEGLPWPKLDLGPISPKVEALFANPAGPPAICIHTGPTWTVREWPLAEWDKCVEALRAKFGCRVLHIGASKHFREGSRKERAVQGTEDCRDIYTLLETVQIIARCRMLVGIDSGMIHAAVAFGLPVVGVFGPTSAALRLPKTKAAGVVADGVPCLGCHHRHPRLHWQSGCVTDIQCMRTLRSEQVLAEVIRLW